MRSLVFYVAPSLLPMALEPVEGETDTRRETAPDRGGFLAGLRVAGGRIR
jgi:hypothetical protein